MTPTPEQMARRRRKRKPEPAPAPPPPPKAKAPNPTRKVGRPASRSLENPRVRHAAMLAVMGLSNAQIAAKIKVAHETICRYQQIPGFKDLVDDLARDAGREILRKAYTATLEQLLEQGGLVVGKDGSVRHDPFVADRKNAVRACQVLLSHASRARIGAEAPAPVAATVDAAPIPDGPGRVSISRTLLPARTAFEEGT